jgi:putative phosphoribosyl transferase
MRFEDRTDAGRQLAERLIHLRSERPIVVALPRGGVPVGYQIARALDAPLDVLIARKLGAPGQPELGIGAIAQGGALYLHREILQMLGVPRDYLERVAAAELAEIERRLRRYRGSRPPLDVHDRTAIVVDDGLATGVTMHAAVRALREQQPRRLVLAVPVGAPETVESFRDEVDEVVVLQTPAQFHAVGLWYRDFTQTTDEEVLELLARAERERAAQPSAAAVPPGNPGSAAVREHAVRLPADGVMLDGDLALPPGARGVVLFAHGSGSSRHSPRNRYVARVLREAGLGTLLMDLLTREEEALDSFTGQLRFDIDLLAARLVAATDWLQRAPETRGLPVGYFGASTGGGAARVAAAQRPDVVAAIVSRGGRPDLAGRALPAVRAPTLLLVGGDDEPVIGMNEEAMEQMRARVKLSIIPGATHLFEEPGTLEQVAQQAAEWFVQHLQPTAQPKVPPQPRR